MNKYLTTIKLSFNQKLEHRFNILIGTITRLLFFFTIAALWEKIYQHHSSIKGISLEEMISYTLLATIVSSVVDTNIGREIHRQIKDGKISIFLTKPLSFMNYYLSSSLGAFLFEVIISGLLFTTFTAIYPHLHYQHQLFKIITFLISLLLGFIIYTQLYLMIGIAAFWITEANFLISIMKKLVKFLAGGYISIVLFPQTIQNFLKFLPFSSTVYFPTTILTNQNLTANTIAQNLLLQLIWIAILMIVLLLFWKQGIRRYEAIGI